VHLRLPFCCAPGRPASAPSRVAAGEGRGPGGPIRGSCLPRGLPDFCWGLGPLWIRLPHPAGGVSPSSARGRPGLRRPRATGAAPGAWPGIAVAGSPFGSGALAAVGCALVVLARDAEVGPSTAFRRLNWSDRLLVGAPGSGRPPPRAPGAGPPSLGLLPLGQARA